MNQEKYVIRLIESPLFGHGNGTFIGYWTGTKHYADDVWFPGVRDDKHDNDVKVYTSKKRAENAVKKLKDKFTYVRDAMIETFD